MELFVKLLAAAVIIGVLEFLWLGVIAKSFYHGEIGELLLDKTNMKAGLIFYAIYIIGILVFVVSPALEESSWQHALGYGALFGFVAYATYDLTNLATLQGFGTKVAVIDIIWGTFLTATVSIGTYAAVKTFA